MRIIVDAMGGDYAPVEIVKGCVDAVREYNVNIILVGKEELVRKELDDLDAPMEHFDIVNATDVISVDEAPVMAIRRKKESSMVKGLELLKEDPESVFISAGSTGALMAGGLLRVGRLKGIDRPALAPFIPNKKNGALLIDAGANADCKPDNLVEFAIMGSVYMEKVMGRENPKVGLINIGQEETKGNELTKTAYSRLKDLKNINFVGNVEARDIPQGLVDVLVCDGFVGNTVLKLTEGLALSIFEMLKDEFTRTFITKMGALLLKPGLKNFKKQMDYSEHGGAPLLGVNGGIIKAHGSSKARAIKNAVRQGILFLENGVLKSISRNISENKEV